MSGNRVRNSFGPRGAKLQGGASRLIFINNSGLNNNRFISGAEVGALNGSVRQALRRRASSRNTNT